MKDQSQIRWKEQCESDFFLVINDNVELSFLGLVSI